MFAIGGSREWACFRCACTRELEPCPKRPNEFTGGWVVLHSMQLSQFSEVQVTPARGTVTITAQSEVQYASVVALLLSLYLILEAEALSHTRCIRLAWGCLGPLISVIRFGNFISRASRTVTGADDAGIKAGVNGADLSSAMLFGALAVVGTWAVDFLAPPQFPPPLFGPPLGLSVRIVKHCLLEFHLALLPAAWLTCVGLVGGACRSAAAWCVAPW